MFFRAVSPMVINLTIVSKGNLAFVCWWVCIFWLWGGSIFFNYTCVFCQLFTNKQSFLGPDYICLISKCFIFHQKFISFSLLPRCFWWSCCCNDPVSSLSAIPILLLYSFFLIFWFFRQAGKFYSSRRNSWLFTSFISLTLIFYCETGIR